MSAPTKCDTCGVTGTYAIAAPCARQCGGLMYYDKAAALSPAPLGEPVALFDTFYAALPDYEMDECWSDDDLREAFSVALTPLFALLEREARSLNDYANEVSNELTEMVLRESAKRLRALSPAHPEQEKSE